MPAVALAPTPKQQFLDDDGTPLVSGSIESYAAGTTAPLATYTDSTGTTANANPLALDSAGRANVWLAAATNYKIILKRADGSVAWTVDNVRTETVGTLTAALLSEFSGSDGATKVGVILPATGAVARTVAARAADTMKLPDFLPSGFVTDGSVDYSSEIQAAFNAADAHKRTLHLIGGDFQVSGSGLLVPSGVKIKGDGRAKTLIKNLNGTVLRLNGLNYDFTDFMIRSVSGGHAVVQTGPVSQSQFRRFGIIQDADGYSQWSNAGYSYIGMRFEHHYLQHTETATVPGFNLISSGGDINDNSWCHGWIQYSGNYAFNVEATGTVDQSSNSWVDNTFEVCPGGGVRNIASKDFTIYNNRCWDVTDGSIKKIKKDFYLVDVNANGVTCSGEVISNSRRHSVLDTGVYDLKLASGGGSSDMTIFGNSTKAGGGDPFQIDANSNFVFLIAPNTVCQADNVGNATVFDPLSGTLNMPAGGYRMGGIQVVGAQQTGWTGSTGTANKGAFATYAGQTHGAAYSQSAIQSLDDSSKANAQRLKALEDALRAHGLIN